MSDQSKLGLGQIITTEQFRDAIHVAIAPVMAHERLLPGDHVGLNAAGEATQDAAHIGIIDPFLKVKSVAAGEKCWIFLYPGSITSLRHDWTHPAFQEKAAPVSASRSAAEKRIADFAEEIGVSEEYVMEKLGDAFNGHASGGDDSTAEKFNEQKAELFNAFAAITGRYKDDIEGTYFSCSC